MNQRIFRLRKELGLSQREFAEKIGLKQNTVSRIEKEGSPVTENNLKLICATFRVREPWLRSGSGEMFLQPGERQRELKVLFTRLSPAGQDYLVGAARALLKMQEE